MSNDLYNDSYLLSMIYESSDDATELLYQKYQNLIKYKSKKYVYCASKIGLDLDDLIQEGNIGFSQAISDYANHKNVLFSTFANLCIEREIQSAVQKASRKKHSVLNESISMDVEIAEGIDLTNIVSSKVSAEDIVLNNIFEASELQGIVEQLTELEKKVFLLKFEGFEYVEIADILSLTPKQVDNAIQRIKKKAKVVFDYGN